MAVENRIVKVQKRNRALVKFDDTRIRRAIFHAAASIGGFQQDLVPGVNETIFQAHGTDDKIAEFLADAVVVCLNSDPHHLISNFPPTIEMIQDEVLHALRSYGFQNTADAYECYRWGRHWLREGAITADKFVGNGFPRAQMDQTLAWNRQHGCDTVAGLNEIVRSGKIKPLVDESLALYESSLDEAAGKVLGRLNAGDKLRMMWVSGPSSSGKTTTTVKLTERLQKQGLRFLMLNLDDYFWSLVDHPTDWINDRNYETPEALDIQLLNGHLARLLGGETIEKPIYSFKEGRRTATKPIKLEQDQILLLDCLHGLYPPITEGIPVRPSSASTSRPRTSSTKTMAATSGAHNSPTCVCCGGCYATRGTATTARCSPSCTGITSAPANCSASSPSAVRLITSSTADSPSICRPSNRSSAARRGICPAPRISNPTPAFWTRASVLAG